MFLAPSAQHAQQQVLAPGNPILLQDCTCNNLRLLLFSLVVCSVELCFAVAPPRHCVLLAPAVVCTAMQGWYIL